MDNEYIRTVEMDVNHDVDGWKLVDMERYPEDGMSCFQYERTVPGEGVELAITWRPQPVTFKHTGWWQRDRTERVLGFTDRDRLRIERGLYNEPVEFNYE